MKRKYSLKKNEDIQAILKSGRAFKNNDLIVTVRKNNLDQNRVAFLVGKKLGTAPVRNQVKRRMRAALREIWEDLDTGYDIIILARPYIVGKKTPIVRKGLEYLLKKHRIVLVQKPLYKEKPEKRK